MESSWIFWISLLLAWTVLGLVVAYVFGGFARRSEASESTTHAPRVVTYLRRQKRPNRPLRPTTHIRIRRAAGGKGRH
jgi:nitrate reductase gamma subunit